MAEENNTAAVQTETVAAEPAAEPAAGTASVSPEPAPPPEPPKEPEPELEVKPAEGAPKASQKEKNAAEKPPEIALLEGKVHALSVGAKPETVDDVLTLARANVREGVSLEQAIDGVLERYPVFKGEKPLGITSSVATGNDEAAESDDEFINKIMGIK
ncbi:MAG: hypothetical protein NC084_09700 [Bacteroides sp.]|nr:hypothetical protein [Eubacterium sp.]MCM1419633.1 hypothetical protein [Roseburia sp.]MCM1462971.1 hypothetical protein [Bacteroides sp.]